jgi:quaternary ammonium compound-resistance protein SugE
MAWTYLLLASVFEIVMALSLKASVGFTRPPASAAAVVSGGASVVLLAQALRTLPVGTGYTAWTGIGAVGSVVLGILFFDESADLARLVSIALIIAGVIGLRITSAG